MLKVNQNVISSFYLKKKRISQDIIRHPFMENLNENETKFCISELIDIQNESDDALRQRV